MASERNTALDYALNQLYHVASGDTVDRELCRKTEQQARKELTEMRERLARLEAARDDTIRRLTNA